MGSILETILKGLTIFAILSEGKAEMDAWSWGNDKNKDQRKDCRIYVWFEAAVWDDLQNLPEEQRYEKLIDNILYVGIDSSFSRFEAHLKVMNEFGSPFDRLLYQGLGEGKQFVAVYFHEPTPWCKVLETIIKQTLQTFPNSKIMNKTDSINLATNVSGYSRDRFRSVLLVMLKGIIDTKNDNIFRTNKIHENRVRAQCTHGQTKTKTSRRILRICRRMDRKIG